MSWLTSALIASLWADTGIAILALAIRSLQAGPESRYGTLMASLACMLVTPCLLALSMLPQGFGGSAVGSNAVIVIWAVGATLCLVRALIGADSLRRMLRESVPCESEVCLRALQGITRQLGLRAIPEVRIVGERWTPCAVGVCRAVIVLPGSLVTRLSPEQLGAVLAHEAAHIRRSDFLANLIQSVIEALLFFHPAIWLISHLARVERELCCDDLVLRSGSDRRVYATALAEIARAGRSSAAPAAGAVGVPFRIARLLGGHPVAPVAAPRSFAGACALCLAIVPSLLFFAESRWTVSLPMDELPRDWTAQSIARIDRDQIEIRLRTRDGDGKIVLDRPSPAQPSTWFEINGYRFEGKRDSAGNVNFVRRK